MSTTFAPPRTPSPRESKQQAAREAPSAQVVGPFTEADLAALPDALPSGPVLWELDNGRIVAMAPPGDIHGVIEARIAYLLIRDGESKGYGTARSGEVGIILWREPADKVVGADAAFVATKSLPLRHSKEGYLETIPDLVAEVVSKNDSDDEVDKKTANYLKAGVRFVWIADPVAKTVTVHRPALPPQVLTMADELTIEDLIPGLCMKVAELFADRVTGASGASS